MIETVDTFEDPHQGLLEDVLDVIDRDVPGLHPASHHPTVLGGELVPCVRVMLPEPLDERRGGIKKQGLVHDDRFGCSQLGKRNATSLPWISKSLSKRSGKVSERNSESAARFGSLEKKRKNSRFLSNRERYPHF
jgi:hypothetical protein